MVAAEILAQADIVAQGGVDTLFGQDESDGETCCSNEPGPDPEQGGPGEDEGADNSGDSGINDNDSVAGDGYEGDPAGDYEGDPEPDPSPSPSPPGGETSPAGVGGNPSANSAPRAVRNQRINTGQAPRTEIEPPQTVEPPRSTVLAAPVASLAATVDSITTTLSRSNTVCSQLPVQYQVDCLSVYYRKALAETPRDREFAEVRTVLRDTANKLDKLARANRDTTQPRLKVRPATGPDTIKTGPITAVKPETVEATRATALAIIEEAETLLLRSAETRAEGQNEFAQIAEAIGSTKVLLRS